MEKLSLCYSIVYCYNGVQRYEQFLEVGRLYRALILLGSAPCLPSGLHGAIYTIWVQVFQFTSAVHYILSSSESWKVNVQQNCFKKFLQLLQMLTVACSVVVSLLFTLRCFCLH